MDQVSNYSELNGSVKNPPVEVIDPAFALSQVSNYSELNGSVKQDLRSLSGHFNVSVSNYSELNGSVKDTVEIAPTDEEIAQLFPTIPNSMAR